VDPDQTDSVLASVEESEAELAVTRVADCLDWLEVGQDHIGDALGRPLEL
jgi:hypothetical protein